MWIQNELENDIDGRVSHGYGGLFYGVYPAQVTDLEDPNSEGRVRIQLPWSPDTDSSSYETWARLATMMAGNNRGSWFIPDVGDEVLVCFQAGDPRHPFVVGMLWNGSDAPPESIDSQNNIKSIRSRNGVKITMDDQSGQESITIETPGGNTVKISDGPGTIEMQDSNGNSIKLDPGGITMNASAKVSITCGQMEVNAGQVSVNTGMATFSGVVQSQTNITNTTVSSTYTPGAGNIW